MVTVQHTVEEIMFEYAGRRLSADCEFGVEYDIHSAEKPTYDYPGCPACAEQLGAQILQITIYDEKGNVMPVTNSEMFNWIHKHVTNEVEKWIVNNDEQLVEWAFDEASQKDEAARDAAAEARFNAYREDRRYVLTKIKKRYRC